MREPWLACLGARVALQRLRMGQETPCVRAVHAALDGLGEDRATMIEARAERAAAWGTDERVEGEFGHKRPPGLSSNPLGSCCLRAHFAGARQRACENRRFR